MADDKHVQDADRDPVWLMTAGITSHLAHFSTCLPFLRSSSPTGVGFPHVVRPATKRLEASMRQDGQRTPRHGIGEYEMVGWEWVIWDMSSNGRQQWTRPTKGPTNHTVNHSASSQPHYHQ